MIGIRAISIRILAIFMVVVGLGLFSVSQINNETQSAGLGASGKFICSTALLGYLKHSLKETPHSQVKKVISLSAVIHG